MAEPPVAITSENAASYIDSLGRSLSLAARASAFLAPSDVPLFRASSAEFDAGLTATASQLLKLTNRIMAQAAKATGASVSGKPIPRFSDADDVVDGFGKAVALADVLLERADSALDEARGISSRPQLPSRTSAAASTLASSTSRKAPLPPSLLHARHLTKPQLLFPDPVDNSNSTHFVGKLKTKPNAKVPLEWGMPGSGELDTEMEEHVRSLGIVDANNSGGRVPHPYTHEITTIDYPQHIFESPPPPPQPPVPPSDEEMTKTLFTWVDTEEGLDAMMEKLRGCKEIAVDTEAHSYRSFQGFVCLVQISTREEDFVVDTLALRGSVQKLNEVFTDPEVVKVFHGADSDIAWLQRDFGVYIVCLFDTYHATHALRMPHHGLAYLLERIIGVETDKRYQMADWRMRPIPAEMLKYARMDTHYLLRIYDALRVDLLALPPEVPPPQSHVPAHAIPPPPGPERPIHTVLRRSAQTSLITYTKDHYDFATGEGSGGWRAALRRHGAGLNAEQAEVFRHLHAWRDRVAREEDESTAFVMPAGHLVGVAAAMPADVGGLVAAGGTAVLVRKRALEVVEAVRMGREEYKRRTEREEARRKADGEVKKVDKKAVHTRFDEGGDVVEGDDAAAENQEAHVERVPLVSKRVPQPVLLAHAGLFGGPATASSRPTNPSVPGAFVEPSSFASSLLDSERPDADSVVARQLADEIRRTLRLAPPGAELLRRKVAEDGMAAAGTDFVFKKPTPSAPAVVGAEDAEKTKEGKRGRKEVEEEPIVLSDLKRRKLVDGKSAKNDHPDVKSIPPGRKDREPAEDMIDLDQYDSFSSDDQGRPAMLNKSGSNPTITEAPISTQAGDNKNKRKKKKKKKLSNGTASSSASSSPAISRPGTPSEPFDYSKARSAAVDAISLVVSAAEKTSNGKLVYDRDSKRLEKELDSDEDIAEASKLLAEGKRAKGFNPFKDPEPEKKGQKGGAKKAEPRLPVAPRGGNKSYSWK
ncbi:hypothetical protein M427DRAFT_32545 [Gonapodya prolifera JEL478]|uniref:HRDC domain-containing protein n=1 Tax=Gonapodya prolifera (strain JEL478) TaxID=1344416 RepID=A0A139AE62_GONPJ|nr:hypothetical protein M427DRAFT_32545 [Gonapodya prolifera JEL478]|eukprot:KXS15057.1 hypothetical protein M427DRAFT_32545 [Gonapodya prolifera JEL478]